MRTDILRRCSDASRRAPVWPRGMTVEVSRNRLQCRYLMRMFGKGQHDELLRELTWLRRRVSELEEDRARGLRLASVTDATRSHDQLGRTAQAEFGLLLPDTDAHGALPALERPSDRPYRAARPHLDAVEELTRCAGRQFDPRVTEAVIGHLYGQRQARLAAS